MPYGSRNISEQYVGASVSVLYGPGLGGTARVKRFVPTNSSWRGALEVVLQPPLLTRPAPGQSYIAINPFRGGMTWEGCTYANDTTWQLWAQATDVILAGSYFENFPGGGDVRSWALFYQCPWAAPFSCAWQPNIGIDFLDNTLRCVSMNAVTSDYSGYTPVNLTLNLGLTRRGNTLLGGSVLGSGRSDDILVEGTELGAAECAGKAVPAGSVAIAASVPHVMVR